ncbi:VOC family protein [Kutzneria kofuensis]|uniref:Catechol 2,3-dioxygenase-like lactoylglutathione lyase family enzyme n=1 Tax=Kutzneria kofuensis TaxID=103725 RepID=A0A7W9KHI1_9PSEU|nr:VOC family protein [Kutzneria kofuensis]MBB5892693.1 catechol 2,3-dioxygenase-like lactoylglutathione lyase family enzyme [Kutzneria kofuensis]
MPVSFNHTIIPARDREESARFYRELFEVPEAPSWGVFTNIQLSDGVLLQFAEPPVDIQMHHYAFLVDDELFDRAYRRLVERGIEHWADPFQKQPGEINTDHGGRGVYFFDPAGHGLEMITRPYL